MAQERVQKILAQAGFGSRRACEEFIKAGRVKVNGERVELGAKADPDKDHILLDQQPVKVKHQIRYIALYKPRNVLSTTGGAERRRKVTDLVPGGEQLHLVGRLDRESEGLMLLTNDGDLTNRLTHPSYGHEKEYRVLVARHPDEKQLSTWRRGVVLSDGHKTLPANVSIERNQGDGTWLRVIIKEGRKRQIREVATLIGLPVVKLIRVRIASLSVGKMKSGEWRDLSAEEVAQLKGKSATTRGR